MELDLHPLLSLLPEMMATSLERAKQDSLRPLAEAQPAMAQAVFLRENSQVRQRDLFLHSAAAQERQLQ